MTGDPGPEPPDRFVTGVGVHSPIVPWRPSQPASLSLAYRVAVQDYLIRNEDKTRAMQEAAR